MDDNMMKAESQNIEFKESWRDEYQKWICGFANAQGGTLYIGLRDNGEVCGVQDAKKLMEDIPNKVRLRVYGQPLSLSTRKGLRSKATGKLPKRLPKRLYKT